MAVLVALAGFLFLSTRLDLFEAAVRLARAGEAWALDEVVALLFVSGVAAIALLWRRTRDLSREIVRREIAEQKAIEQTELLSLAQRAAGAAAWSVDFKRSVTTLSPAAREMLGLPAEHDGKITDKEWAEFLDPQDIEALSEAILRAAREGGGLSKEYRFRGRDGRLGWLQSVGRIVEGESGEDRRLIGLTFDVTERMKAAQDVRESEERLRLALEAAGDGAWEWDLSRQSVSVSDRLVRNLGYESHRFDGKVESFLSLIHRDDLPRMQQAVTDHLAGRSDSYRCEYRLRSRNRTWRWNLDRGRVVARDPETGRATRIVGTSSDITAFKDAEQQALDQTNLLALAQTGAGAGPWSHDLVTRVTTLSAEAKALIGLPATHSGILGLADWAEIMHPDDIEARRAALSSAIRQGKDLSSEYRIRQPDGSYRWFQSLGRMVDDGSGQQRRLIGLLLDVTDRKAASNILRESEERLRLALEATGDGAWDWNFATRQVSRSERLVEQLGYRPEEFGTRADFYLSLMHPDDLPEARRALREYLQGRRRSYQAEYRIQARDGRWHWIFDRGRAAARDAAGRVTRMVGTGSDVTERKEAEIELERVQGELIHLSRLTAMGDMAATLAHELNQPLTAMANFARGIRHCTNLEGQELLAEAVDGIEQSAERAGEIVRRLREYVLSGEVQRREVSLSQIVRDACGLALVDAGSLGIEHEVRLNARADTVLVDKIQIQQVLLNLIRNAVEAMAAGGTERRVRISSRRARRKQVEIAVADSGPGIPDDMLDQLFTPFVSTKAEGMGVGLSICRTIVEAHGGRIWVEPAGEGGSIMRFTLPRA